MSATFYGNLNRRQETGDRRQETGFSIQDSVFRSQEIIFIYSPHTLHPTPHTPHPTTLVKRCYSIWIELGESMGGVELPGVIV
ncbi:MAG: hypothetical protein GPJ33_10885 [Microcystis aeruginosa W11-03]|nr:hypothetical protein [Microcystis aeruginosa W11-03]